MESPGEPGAGPLGAPGLSNFAPARPEREKLVKLEGQPGGAGEGWQSRACPRAEEGERAEQGSHRPPPPQVCRPPLGPRRTPPTTCLEPAGGRRAGPRGRGAA